MKRAQHFKLGLPNTLSILRIVLVPVFVVVLFATADDKSPVWAGCILLLSSLTDFLDGFIARKCHMESYLGKILDPAADKLTQAAVAISIGIVYDIPIMAALFVLKELLMAIGGLVIFKKGRKIAGSKWFGKVSTVAFFVMTLAILFFVPADDRTVASILMTIAIGFMVFAFFMYIPEFIKITSAIKQSKKDRDNAGQTEK